MTDLQRIQNYEVMLNVGSPQCSNPKDADSKVGSESTRNAANKRNDTDFVITESTSRRQSIEEKFQIFEDATAESSREVERNLTASNNVLQAIRSPTCMLHNPVERPSWVVEQCESDDELLKDDEEDRHFTLDEIVAWIRSLNV